MRDVSKPNQSDQVFLGFVSSIGQAQHLGQATPSHQASRIPPLNSRKPIDGVTEPVQFFCVNKSG